MTFLLDLGYQLKDAGHEAPLAGLEHPSLHIGEALEVGVDEFLERLLRHVEPPFDLGGRGAEGRGVLVAGLGLGGGRAAGQNRPGASALTVRRRRWSLPRRGRGCRCRPAGTIQERGGAPRGAVARPRSSFVPAASRSRWGRVRLLRPAKRPPGPRPSHWWSCGESSPRGSGLYERCRRRAPPPRVPPFDLRPATETGV